MPGPQEPRPRFQKLGPCRGERSGPGHEDPAANALARGRLGGHVSRYIGLIGGERGIACGF